MNKILFNVQFNCKLADYTKKHNKHSLELKKRRNCEKKKNLNLCDGFSVLKACIEVFLCYFFYYNNTGCMHLPTHKNN